MKLNQAFCLIIVISMVSCKRDRAILETVKEPKSSKPLVIASRTNISFPNANFDTSGPTQTPSTWLEAGDLAASYTQTGGRSSNRLSHWATGAYDAYTNKTITGLTNGTYTITVWSQSVGNQPACYIKAKNYGGIELIANLPASNGWTQISIHDIKVTNGQLEIGFYSHANAGEWANLDDFVLTKEDEVTVPNGGFESSGATQTPTGWTETGSVNASYTQSGGHSGSYRLSHYSSSAYEVFTYRTVTGLANGTYSLSAWVQSSGWQEDNYIEVKNYGDSALMTSLPAESGWIKIYIRGIKVTNGQIQIGLYSNASAGNWCNIDDFILVNDYIEYSFIKGVDPSYLLEKEPLGVTYKDKNGVTKDALQIYQENGINYARIRVWTDNANNQYEKNEVMALALRAHSKGMKILLCIHYSKTWASAHAAEKPTEWASLNFTGLKTALYNYTYDLVNSLKAQGTTPAMVQIGNESNHGFLWPDGQVNHSGNYNWDNYAELLKQGIKAVHDVSSTTLTAIHSDDASSITSIHDHLDALWGRGVRPDVLAFSYYTSWNVNTLDGVTNAMTDAITSYGLPVVIVETAYPWVSGSSNYIYKTSNEAYPLTPIGQKEFMKELISRIKALPAGKGLGVMYWGPDGIEPTSKGWQWNNGSAFDFTNGMAFPVLDAFYKN